MRPVEGGLAIGFTSEELKAQAAKRARWLQEDADEHNRIRAKVASNAEKSSSRALSVMLLVWACVIGAIFFTVWRTMAHGLASMVSSDANGQRLPASTLLFNAFKQQLSGGMTSIGDAHEDYV